MEQSSLAIRLANIGDVPLINDLLYRNAPQYLRDNNFWVWMHRLISDNNSIIAIALQKEKVIAHYAIIPSNVLIDGQIFSSGLGVHALVDKDCIGVSIMQITQFAYREAQKRGIRFIYGFPNKNYRLIQEKIEKWKKIKLFQSFELSIDFDNKISSPEFVWEVRDCNYSTLFEISRLIDEPKNSCIRIKKILSYYYFRYINHPQIKYHTIFIYKEGIVAGCLFLKIYTHESDIRLHLVDFLKTPALPYSDVLFFLKYFAHQNKIPKISQWPVNNEFRNELLEQNFEQIGFDTFFGVKILDNNISNYIQDKLLDFNSWELMMGDSDAF